MTGLVRIDPESLGWIRSEIDVTLGQAREYLSDFEPTRDDGDVTPFRMVANDLHQVVGTLQMMEIDGAAMLAEEIEALADALVNGAVSPESDSTGLLNQGLGALSDYLDHLHKGLPDLPIKQIDMLNGLRDARGESPLDPFSLFHPDLDKLPPKNNNTRLSDDEYKQTAHRLRREYQKHLLGWLRDADKDALKGMASIVREMSQIARFGKVSQLWWVTEALLEVLAGGVDTATIERNKLLGRLDQKLRALSEDGEAALIRESPEDLIRQMLFEIGQCHDSLPHVEQMRAAFDLDVLLSGEFPVDEAELATLPTSEQLFSLRDIVRSDLDSAQESLGAYFGDQAADENVLDNLISHLNAVLSQTEQRTIKPVQSLIGELVHVANDMREGKPVDREDASLEMASVLLFLDESLKGVHTPDLDWKDEIDAKIERLRTIRLHTVSVQDLTEADKEKWSEEALGATEFKQVMTAVAGEIHVNLNKIEAALESYADTQRPESLESVPQDLKQVHGVLQILGQHRVAELLGMADECVQTLIAGTLAPDRALIDALAVAVGTAQAYVQRLEHGRPKMTDTLDRAIRDLEDAVTNRELDGVDPHTLVAEIRDGLDYWFNDNADYQSLGQLRRNLRRIVYFADQRDHVSLYQISSELSNLMDIVTDEPALLTEEVRDTLTRSLNKLAALVGELPATTQAQSPPPVVEASPIQDTELQADILEIYFEEAGECFQVIDETLPAWRHDTGNQKTMTDLRRQFHTLKGSGRMAGVGKPAELAWFAEDLLNHVIDGKLEISESVFDFIESTINVLKPVLQNELQGAAQIDLEMWNTKAQRILTQPEQPAAVGRPDTEAVVEIQEVDTTAAAEAPADQSVAEEVEQGEPPEHAVAAKAVADASEVVTHQSPDQNAAPQAVRDDSVIDIFTKETLQHLSVIRASLNACKKNAQDCGISEELLRSLHTLRGSSRSVGLVDMSDACESVDGLLHTVLGASGALGTDEMELLDQLAITCAKVLDKLQQDGEFEQPSQPAFAQVIDRSEALKMPLARPQTVIEADSADDAKETPPDTPPEPDLNIVDDVSQEVVTAHSARESLEEIRRDLEHRESTFETMIPLALREELTGIKEVLETESDVATDFRDIFCEEALTILGRIDHQLANWNGEERYADISAALKRDLHTLKGSARAAGADPIGELSHNTETLLERTEKQADVDHRELQVLLEEVHDTLFNMVQHLEQHRVLPDVSEFNQTLLDYYSEAERVTDENTQRPDPAYATSRVETENTSAAPAVDAARETVSPGGGPPADTNYESSEAAIGPEAQQERIRVNASALDDLFNYAGEVSVSRAQMEGQLTGLKTNLNELRSNVTRFSDQLRDLEIQAETQGHAAVDDKRVTTIEEEFDPLEFDRYTKLQQLSRSLSESLDDLMTIESGLAGFAHTTESVLQHQALLSNELQGGLMRARMVPFSTLIPRLRHHTRQSSRVLGKRADLQVVGQYAEIDRNVLETMTEAFEHMIRNAIDHGIETNEQRMRAGKPQVGTIRIECKQEGNEIMVRFSDDGAGLDVEKIRTKAQQMGLSSAEIILTDQDLIQLIVTPGFSTTDAVTQVSGRGVGLDVVHSAVRHLGGTITVENAPGEGATFVIRLPVTLSVTHALFVRCGDQTLAIPLGVVQRVVKIDSDTLPTTPGHMNISIQGQNYPLMDLSARLGLSPEAKPASRSPILVVRMGAQDIGVRVDELWGTQEVVVKPVGGHLDGIQGITGATVRGDGSVVLILDLAELWVTDETVLMAPAVLTTTQSAAVPVIMVVDDSLTVRKVTSRNLSRHGMEVFMAKDGIEALDQIRVNLPDLMLVDIEMPRMDGYELTSQIRSNAATRDIPIVIITSRAGAKHKEKAMELGANAYLTKPYQEEELLANVQELLPQFFSQPQSTQVH